MPDGIMLWLTLHTSAWDTAQARVALGWVEVGCAWLIGLGCHRLGRAVPRRPLARLFWRSALTLLNMIGILSLLVGSVSLYLSL